MFGLLIFNTIGFFGSNNNEGARCSGGTGELLYLHFAYADGGLFRRVDVVDGGGGGTLFEVAETLVDAAKAEEGDNTDDAVKEWIDEGALRIRYIYRENGGKMRAHNTGTSMTDTELFVCLDSDDYFVQRMTEPGPEKRTG